MILRKAKMTDVPGIAALIAENLDTILKRSPAEIEGLIDCFWVIEEDNAEITGCACLEVYSSKIAEIRTVAVRKSCRRRGYGKMLVQAAVEEAKKLNIHEVMAITSTPEFFRQINFGPCLNEKFAVFFNGSDGVTKKTDN